MPLMLDTPPDIFEGRYLNYFEKKWVLFFLSVMFYHLYKSSNVTVEL